MSTTPGAEPVILLGEISPPEEGNFEDLEIARREVLIQPAPFPKGVFALAAFPTMVKGSPNPPSSGMQHVEAEARTPGIAFNLSRLLRTNLRHSGGLGEALAGQRHLHGEHVVAHRSLA